MPDPVPSKNRDPYGHLANARSQVETLQLASVTASNERNLRYVIGADLVAKHERETLTNFSFPCNHWRQIKTNNPLERIIRE